MQILIYNYPIRVDYAAKYNLAQASFYFRSNYLTGTLFQISMASYSQCFINRWQEMI